MENIVTVSGPRLLSNRSSLSFLSDRSLCVPCLFIKIEACTWLPSSHAVRVMLVPASASSSVACCATHFNAGSSWLPLESISSVSRHNVIGHHIQRTHTWWSNEVRGGARGVATIPAYLICSRNWMTQTKNRKWIPCKSAINIIFARASWCDEICQQLLVKEWLIDSVYW